MIGGRIEVQSELGKGSGEPKRGPVATSSPAFTDDALFPFATLAFRFFIECRTVNSVTPALSHSNVKPEPAQQQTRESLRRRNVSTTLPIEAVKKLSLAGPSSSAHSPKASKVLPRDALHVLIVGDNIINQTVLKRQMIKSGFTCDGECLYF